MPGMPLFPRRKKSSHRVATLLPDGKIDRVRVVRRLPYGLTENAILAACEIKFKAATKAGQPVAQWLTVQYGFRLAESSIFGP